MPLNIVIMRSISMDPKYSVIMRTVSMAPNIVL